MIHSTYTHPGVNATLLAISRATRARVMARRSGCSEYVLAAHGRFISRLHYRLWTLGGRA